MKRIRPARIRRSIFSLLLILALSACISPHPHPPLINWQYFTSLTWPVRAVLRTESGLFAAGRVAHGKRPLRRRTWRNLPVE